jgi:hypothetical protein
MDTAKPPDDPRDIASFAPAAGEAAPEPPTAWEQIANGRYMPRRVRGSCLGRELG